MQGAFFARGVQLQTAMMSVPQSMSARPAAALRLTFSLRKRAEKSTVTSMLILSIGTTTLTTPFCMA